MEECGEVHPHCLEIVELWNTESLLSDTAPRFPKGTSHRGHAALHVVVVALLQGEMSQ